MEDEDRQKERERIDKDSQRQMERNFEELDRQIVRFTNIDKESFTHAYKGISTTVLPGASQIMRLPEADHLATHLARKIISRDKKGKMTEMDKQKGIQLFNDKEIYEMKTKILSQVAQETSTRISPEEAHRRDQENLQERYDNKPVKKVSPKEITKKDIIKDLESRGATVDASKTKEELIAQLMELEAQGK